MPEQLNWQFNLADALTTPAANMAASIDMLSSKLKSAALSADDFERRMKSGGSGLEDTGKKAKASSAHLSEATAMLGELGLALEAVKMVAEPFIELGGAAFEKAWDFGKKATEALAFKESTLASFEVMLGSAKAADEFFKTASFLSQKTPFSLHTVAEAFQGLKGAGFTQQEVPVVFQALGDAAAMKGFDTQIISRMTLAFQEIMSLGQVSGQQMRMVLRDAAGTGLSKEKINKALAKNLGVDPEAIEGMTIDARQGIKAMMDVLQETAGGGIIGGGMLKQRDTFQGIMIAIEKSWSNFFTTLPGRADDVPGFSALKGAAKNFRDALDVSTESGKRMQTAVVSAFSDIATSIFGPLSGPDGLRAMETLVTRTGVAIRDMGIFASAAFDGLWEGAKAFLDVLGMDGSGLTKLFDGPMTPENIDKLRESMKAMGIAAGGALAKLALDAEKIGHAIELVSDLLGMFSVGPKGASFALGALNTVMPGMGDAIVLAALSRAAHNGADMKKQPGAPAAGAGGAAVPPINVHVHAPGATDPAAVGQAAKEGTRSALQDHTAAMRKVATQAGAN